MNNIQQEYHIKRYRNKYKYLKTRIKSLIIENAALCDEVAKIQESIVIVKDERKFLLHKILEYENDHEISQAFCRNEVAISSNGPKLATYLDYRLWYIYRNYVANHKYS